MMKRTIILGISLICLLPACEKSTEWQLASGQDNQLVVQAILTNEMRTQEILLSTTYHELNGNPPSVDHAVVMVVAGGTTYMFNPDPGSAGRYLSQIPFAVVSQLSYELTIDWDGKTYTAGSSLSEVAPIPAIQFTPADAAGNFTVSDNVVPIYHDVQQAMYQFDLNWSHLQPLGENSAKLYYYTFNTVHISEFLRPARADVVFPKGTIARITKFGLSDAFAAYLRAVAIETDWNGIWFYGNSENPPTNLSGGAIGFFATCAVLQQTIIVQ